MNVEGLIKAILVVILVLVVLAITTIGSLHLWPLPRARGKGSAGAKENGKPADGVRDEK